jgi:hypothetical protein
MTVKDVLEVLTDDMAFIYNDYGDTYHEGPANKVEDDVLQMKVVGLSPELEYVGDGECIHVNIIVEGE